MNVSQVQEQEPTTTRSQTDADADAGFQQLLREITPRLWVTPALLLVNTAVFVIMLVRGVHPMSPSIDDLLAWGADFGPLTAGGEPWRLLTCTFVHIGVVHLALNMWVLWDTGRVLERLIGNLGFVALYLAAGVLSSIASVCWHPMLVCAGASGAIFGVVGGLLGVIMLDRGAIPRARLVKMRASMFSFIFYNVIFGLRVDNIDHAAHVGGLVVGLALSPLLVRSAGRQGVGKRGLRATLVVLVAAIAGAATVPLLPTKTAEATRAMDNFYAVEKTVLATYRTILADSRAGKIDDAKLAEVIEREMLPDWTAAEQRLAASTDTREPLRSRIEPVVRYASLRREGWELLARAARSGDKRLLEQSNAKQAAAEKVINEIEKLANAKEK